MNNQSLFGQEELPINYGREIILRQANGIPVRQRADNYFDGTAMCRAYGKNFADYKRLKDTAEFLDALSANMGIPILELVQVRVGGNHSGTWVHRRVAIDIARWCSPIFAAIVNGWVDDIILGKPINVGDATGIDPFVLDKLFANQNEVIRTEIRNEFQQHRQQMGDDIEYSVKSHVPKPKLEFSAATRKAILSEWLRQDPRGLDPTGTVRIIDDNDDLIYGVGELHHMNGPYNVGFRDGLPVWVPFHRKLTADNERKGDEWRRAYNAHKAFLDKADTMQGTLFNNLIEMKRK